jgi:hypothetical protein
MVVFGIVSAKGARARLSIDEGFSPKPEQVGIDARCFAFFISGRQESLFNELSD